MSESPSATPSLAGALATDVHIEDLSFVSADHGFVLASATCRRTKCLLVGETLDGARSWTTLGTLSAADVQRLRFVTPLIGYAYGSGLLMTVDGGRTWRRQPDGADSIEGNQQDVLRVLNGCGGAARLERSTPGSTRWTRVVGKLSPAENSNCGPVLLRDGRSRVVAVGYGNSAKPEPRAWIGSSTDAGEHFTRVADPCDVHAEGYALGVAIAPRDVVAVFCTSYRFDDLGDSTAWLVVSTDGGRHWGRAHAWQDTLGPGTTQYFAGIAAASGTRIVVATSSPHVGHVHVSENGGASWSDGEEISLPYDEALVGFQNPLTARLSSGAHVSTTVDGGRTWRDDEVRLTVPAAR